MTRAVNVVHVNLHFVASPFLWPARAEGGADHGVPSFATPLPTGWSGRYDRGFPAVLVGVIVQPGRVWWIELAVLVVETESGVKAGNEWVDMRRCRLLHVSRIEMGVWTGIRDVRRSRTDQKDVVV